MTTDADKIIEQIREVPSEEKIIQICHEYFNESKKVIKTFNGKRKEQKIREATMLVEEAARRVSKPLERLFLSRIPLQLGEVCGVDAGIIILSPYEENFMESRKWTKEDTRHLRPYINDICKAIKEVASERVDDKFTVRDLSRRVPRESFFIKSFLKQLEKMAFLTFDRFAHDRRGKGSKEVIHLEGHLFSDENTETVDKITRKFEEGAEIPYATVHVDYRNHSEEIGE